MLYLRGKCLDFEPEYTKQAEEFLSKSIKLMPTKTEAWDALGHVYWKKQDIEQSRKCYEGSLEQDDNNKIALRNLSMVYSIKQIMLLIISISVLLIANFMASINFLYY